MEELIGIGLEWSLFTTFCSTCGVAFLLLFFLFPSGPKKLSVSNSPSSSPTPAPAPTTSRILPTSTRTAYGRTTLQEIRKKYPVTLPPKLVLVSDLDHTLFGVGPEETHDEVEKNLLAFNELWCTKYAPNNCILVYATGRPFERYQLAAKEYSNLMIPDVLVAQDGCTLHWFNESLADRLQSLSKHQISFVSYLSTLLEHFPCFCPTPPYLPAV